MTQPDHQSNFWVGSKPNWESNWMGFKPTQIGLGGLVVSWVFCSYNGHAVQMLLCLNANKFNVKLNYNYFSEYWRTEISEQIQSKRSIPMTLCIYNISNISRDVLVTTFGIPVHECLIISMYHYPFPSVVCAVK